MSWIDELNSIAELSYDDAKSAKAKLSKIEVPANFLYLKDAVFTHVAWLNLKPSRIGRTKKI